MEPLMNPLFNIYVNTAEDYFRRLGGSGRFTGYKDWYSPCLVLMELIEVNIPGDVFRRIKYENDISDRLWTDTDDLASNIKHKLENVGLDKEMIESYVAEVSKILSSNLDSRELANWRRFVESVYENIDLIEEHSENSIDLPAPSKTDHSTESHQEATARRKATLAGILKRLGNPVIEPPTPEEIEKLASQFRDSNRAGRWLFNDE
jgi:hypothetical protein